MGKNPETSFTIRKLGFPWETLDPFLFCVYHSDAYPRGNEQLGPASSLSGRNIGNDFTVREGWRMYHGHRVPGFPVHPHRGFETVTVVRRGVVDHSDSMGGAGRYGEGDIQWMTAGKGIQHAEMFPLLKTEEENPLELFQIWLNLPASKKMVDPYYGMIWGDQVPVFVHRDGQGKETRVEIVAGSLEGLGSIPPAPDSWASEKEHEVAILYFQMEGKAEWKVPAAGNGTNRALYFFDGEAVQANEMDIQPGHMLEIRMSGDLTLRNGNRAGRFLYLQGRPINEPVVNFGPFVMNTREEIQQAYQEYQETGFGGWPWPTHDHVHPKESGRFARYPDGHEERPTRTD